MPSIHTSSGTLTQTTVTNPDGTTTTTGDIGQQLVSQFTNAISQANGSNGGGETHPINVSYTQAPYNLPPMGSLNQAKKVGALVYGKSISPSQFRNMWG